MPPEGKPPFPTLVWIHGGPAEHIQQTFSPYFQVFASLGWAIFAPNFRGSTGRDNAFLRANIDNLCDQDGTDVMRGLDKLVRKGLADPAQVATMGWSYGGSLALTIAARSKRISSVVAVAPVADWTSIFGARSYPALTGEYFSSELWEDRAPFDRASPITRVKRIKAPTLFLHGGQDTRVPLEQSRLIFRMLRAQGIETDFVVYPDEQHIFTMPSSIMDMLHRVSQWIGKHSRK
jgi:dipeptidyl aminopeptidase/acylaminoacyl peptidase